MTIIKARAQALLAGEITLDEGKHVTFESGHCALEVVAWLADEAHTDAPVCVSLVLRRFVIGLNDDWGKAQRQKLAPFLPRLVGTAGDGQDTARQFLAVDWLVRVYAPTWLKLAGRVEDAQKLHDLPQIVDKDTYDSAIPTAQNAFAAGKNARFAAWRAAGDAALAVAGDAALKANRYASVDAARVAAMDVTRVAAMDVDIAYARDAALKAATAVAIKAAGDATQATTRGATRAAARRALQPTVEALQDSALELLDRMIDPASTERGVVA